MRKVVPLDVVETIREGLLVLEPDLTIRFANRSFCDKFAVAPEHTVGRKLYELGNGQWDIPKLRSLLETILSPNNDRGLRSRPVLPVHRPAGDGAQRAQGLSARQQDTADPPGDRRRHRAREVGARARGRARAYRLLMQELTHRIKNSLQSIAAMVIIEARSHKSGEGKAALERVSHRIDALGQLYSMLSKSDTVEEVDAATYLEELCRDLVASVQGWHVHRAQDRHRERAPADRPGNSDGAHCERARHECPQICFSERDKGHVM